MDTGDITLAKQNVFLGRQAWSTISEKLDERCKCHSSAFSVIDHNAAIAELSAPTLGSPKAFCQKCSSCAVVSWTHKASYYMLKMALLAFSYSLKNTATDEKMVNDFLRKRVMPVHGCI